MSKKLTIIKVLPSSEDFRASPEDLERWRTIFAEKRMTLEEAATTGEIVWEQIPRPEETDQDNYLTIVKIGGENYRPTFEELENWRELFQEAIGDPDFKIFTHPEVEINVIKIGDVVAVE